MRLDIDVLIELAKRADVAYKRSSDALRREWNFARYDCIEVNWEKTLRVVAVGRESTLFQTLRNAKLPKQTDNRSRSSRRRPIHSLVNGLNFESLVETSGLEPPTPCLQIGPARTSGNTQG